MKTGTEMGEDENSTSPQTTYEAVAKDEEGQTFLPLEIAQDVEKEKATSGLSRMAIIALLVLVAQNTSLALVGRLTLNKRNQASDTIVVCIEITKLIVATLGTLYENNLDASVFMGCFTYDSFKMSIPAVLYFIQNNLVLLSLERLPTAIFQVTYQCKILTTAFFSVMWLKRIITKMQYLSLVLLTMGVALVQFSGVKPKEGIEYTVQDQVTGLVYVLIACCLSGTAGVYFEKVLKSSTDRKQSIMFRNFQLAGFSLLVGAPGVLYRRWDLITTEGVFANYDLWTYVLIGIQAFGGFVVAVVVKHADQVQKGFAVSIAIVVGSVLSMFLFHTTLHLFFWLGAAVVLCSVYMYNTYRPQS